MRHRLDGEIVVCSEIETGYLHRGLEKAMQHQHWRAGTVLADRLDPEGAIFGELAFCMAVEEIASIPVPQRAQDIRVLLCELARISGHMAYIVRVAQAVGAETMVHYILRDRERILDLFELAAGARFAPNFLRFGGVRLDVSEGFIERVLELCDLLRVRIKEYNDLFTFNHIFQTRTRGVACVSRVQALELGLTGPNARAIGINLDARRGHPYSGYDRLDFEIPLGGVDEDFPGDSNGRFMLRLREISVCLDLLKQAAEAIATGATLGRGANEALIVPAGEAYARVESSRGLLGCFLVSDGGTQPARVQFRVPSFANLQAFERVVPGNRLEDIPLIFASFDICIPELDR